MQPVVRGAALSLRDVSRQFRTKTGSVDALRNVCLEVHAGEFLVLLGPSGCGKSTLLRCIAGLERPDTGAILIGDAVVVDADRNVCLPAERRRLNMVFQSYALWPHMTVFRNVAYPLQARHAGDRPAVSARVIAALRAVGVEQLLDRYPGQLSGGQQQRVALARAIVSEDPVVLFDEPLSNVDAKVREQLRDELLRLHRELGFTAVYVTHDQAEAMVLGDRIAVMSHGEIRQLGTPSEIYRAPMSRYVADFVGRATFVEGRVTKIGDGLIEAETPIGKIWGTPAEAGLERGDPVCAMVRPHDAQLGGQVVASGINQWPAKVRAVRFLGTHSEIDLMVGDVALLVTCPGGTPESLPDGATLLSVPAADVRMLRA